MLPSARTSEKYSWHKVHQSINPFLTGAVVCPRGSMTRSSCEQTKHPRFRPTPPPYNEAERVEIPETTTHTPAQGPVYDIDVIRNQPSKSRPPNYSDKSHKDPPPYFSLVDARPPVYQEWDIAPINLDKERPPPRPDSPEFECDDFTRALRVISPGKSSERNRAQRTALVCTPPKLELASSARQVLMAEVC
uniref:Uncharacterized protein n=1 Tax=Trichogramma kaykai TaxID=54128 RepID=A0ABD2VW30_9HYME